MRTSPVVRKASGRSMCVASHAFAWKPRCMAEGMSAVFVRNTGDASNRRHGEAFRIAREEMGAENERIRMLRDRLVKGLSDIEQVFINGDLEHRVPHNLNISFAYIEGESMLMAIKDLLRCRRVRHAPRRRSEPSYVLRALGRDDELAHSSIRFTLGRFTTEEEIEYAIKLLHEKIGKLRELSPLCGKWCRTVSI